MCSGRTAWRLMCPARPSSCSDTALNAGRDGPVARPPRALPGRMRAVQGWLRLTLSAAELQMLVSRAWAGFAGQSPCGRAGALITRPIPETCGPLRNRSRRLRPFYLPQRPALRRSRPPANAALIGRCLEPSPAVSTASCGYRYRGRGRALLQFTCAATMPFILCATAERADRTLYCSPAEQARAPRNVPARGRDA